VALVKRRRSVALFVFVGLLILVTLACEMTVTPGPVAGPAAVVTVSPPPVTESGLQATLEALQVEDYAGAIEAERRRRDAEATLAVIAARQTLTAEAREAEVATLAWQRTLTTEAVRAEQTATAWQLTVEAQQARETATAEANRTATAVAEVRERRTLTAEAGRVAAEVRMTETAWSLTLTAVADEAAAQSTVEAVQLRRLEASARREEITNYLLWTLLAVAVAAVTVGFLVYVMARSDRERFVEISPHALGVFIQEGGRRLALPDRSHLPVLTVEGDVREVAPEDQRATTARAQEVRLVAAAHPPEGGSATQSRQVLQQVLKARAESAPAPGLGPIRVVRHPRHAVAAGLIPEALGRRLEIVEGHVRELAPGDDL
jgi:hypothetical protein